MTNPNDKSERNKKMALAGAITAVVLALLWGGRELYRSPPSPDRVTTGVPAQASAPVVRNDSIVTPPAAIPAIPAIPAPAQAVDLPDTIALNGATIRSRPAPAPAPAQPVAEPSPAAVEVVPAPALAVVAAAPAPIQEAPAALPTPVAVPPKTAMTINESSSLGREFKLTNMEFFLNGSRLDVPDAGALRSQTLFTTQAREGRNDLLVRLTATGNPKYALMYLKDMVFVVEETKTFDAHATDQLTVDVIAYDTHKLLKNMKDRLRMTIQVTSMPAGVDSVPSVPVAQK